MEANQVQQTAEWNALNKIWKNCSKEQRELLAPEFRFLTEFIRKNTANYFMESIPEGYGYLRELSPAARGFVISKIEEGEPNIYHSIMAVLERKTNEPKEQVMEYYYAKFALKRDYIKNNWGLVCEVFNLCWRNWQRKIAVKNRRGTV